MSVLINNNQNRQNIVAWRVLYSQISNAFNYTVNNGFQSCLPNKDVLIPEFVDEFLKNFEVVDTCYGGTSEASSDEICANNKKNYWQGITFSNTKTGYKTLAGGSINAYNMNYKAALLKNGGVLYFGQSLGGPWLSVDVNGYKKGPNVVGKDFFIIKLYSTKILPLGTEGTYSTSVNGANCECSKDKGSENANYFITVGQPDTGKVVSGGCCSAYYLYSK